MDRKKDARPILTVQSCVSEVLLQEIFLNWKYMKWITFWITDKNIKVYTIDSHIVIRSSKYDSFHYFNSCHFHYRVISSIVLISTKKKKKNGRRRCQKFCYRIRISFWIEMKWILFWTTDKDMCTLSSHIRYLNPRLKYHSFHYISIHVISTIDCELTMACSPVGVISSIDIALRPVTAKFRVPFPIQSKFCQVLLQPLWLFIQPRRSCSLS